MRKVWILILCSMLAVPAAGAERGLVPRNKPTPKGKADLRISRPNLRMSGNQVPNAGGLDCGSPEALTNRVPFNGDTSGSVNNVESYGTIPWTESGPEVVHTITTTQTGNLRAALSHTESDLDVFILGSCDPSDLPAYGDVKANYKSAPADTYYIVVDGYNGASGSYTLTVSTCSGILLVDDDGSPTLPDVRAEYTNALDNNLLSYTVWDVYNQGSPGYNELLKYDHVLWFTGGDYRSGQTLTSTDENSLAAFLDGGGNLALIGQDILFDLTGDTDGRTQEGSFINDYLQIYRAYNDVEDTTSVDGLNSWGSRGDPVTANTSSEETAFQDYGIPLTVGDYYYESYTDTIFSYFGLPLFYNGLENPSGLRYNGFLYRLVFSSEPLENLEGADYTDRRDEIIGDIFTWFEDESYRNVDITFVGFTGSDTFPDPGDSLTLTVDVTNNEGASVNTYIYFAEGDPYVATPSETRRSGTIASGATGTGDFTVDLDESTPVGHQVEFQINLYVDGEYDRTSTFGFFIGQAQIFLIKDEQSEPNTTGIDFYRDNLNNLGFTFAEHNTLTYGSPPYNDTSLIANSNMISYGAVIWLTGNDSVSTLGTYDETELKKLMDGGGRLFISSQDYLTDKMGGAGGSLKNFPSNYLFLDSVTQNTVFKASETLNGNASEDISQGMNFVLQDGLSFSNAADSVVPEAGADGLFTMSSTGGILSTVYEGASIDMTYGTGSYRLVYFADAFENMVDGLFPNNKETLLARILYWFDHGPYYPPREVQNLRIDKVSGFEIDLNWDSVSQNTNGESIDIHYNIYRGLNPSNLSFMGETESTTANENESLGPGECFFYEVRAADIAGREGQ